MSPLELLSTFPFDEVPVKHLLRSAALIAGLALSSIRAVASPDVDRMSDIEVSEYAVQMSSVLQKIQNRQLCASQDTGCFRTEFARHGISYDDKESVQKRVVLMIGSVY
ncbi:MAG: hypothetical protein GQ550_06340 [Gammaproteobacteria bacterium]|nr:hypothetical protein [Gammaproteobacteria bacterium]